MHNSSQYSSDLATLLDSQWTVEKRIKLEEGEAEIQSLLFHKLFCAYMTHNATYNKSQEILYFGAAKILYNAKITDLLI